jgi:hypothetical protein
MLNRNTFSASPNLVRMLQSMEAWVAALLPFSFTSVIPSKMCMLGFAAFPTMIWMLELVGFRL